MEGLCCANCAAKIEREVQRIPEVTEANLSFMTQKMTIDAPGERMDGIVEEASRIAKRIEGVVVVKRIR